MANILRKKIALSTGVPPSIQNAHMLWGDLSLAVNTWFLKGLGQIVTSSIIGRSILTGEEVKHNLVAGETFLSFARIGGFGLSAIAMSRNLAVAHAAKRMHQDVASLECSSDLFLSLICEDPTMLLREAIRAYLSGNRHQFKTSNTSDLSYVPADIDPLARYIKVELSIAMAADQEKIRLFFDYNDLKKYLDDQALKSETKGDSIDLERHRIIRNSLHKSDIRVDAVLERIEMSFGACSRLRVGQVLPLLTGDQDMISIAVETVSGSTDISQGKLGIWKQKRAIKLAHPVSDDFIRDIRLASI